jgi:hypothetical protein
MNQILKNKKGQTIITVIFMAIVFLFVWIMFAGKELGRWGQQAIIMGNLTGVEAFGFANLNLIVGFAFLIFIVVMATFSR